MSQSLVGAKRYCVLLSLLGLPTLLVMVGLGLWWGGLFRTIIPAVESEQEFDYVIDGETRKGASHLLTVDLGGGQKMDFVRIAAGSFQMGAPQGEKELYEDEIPQHSVRITHDYYLARTVVTQDQYQTLTGKNPSYFKSNGSLPVVNVSWEEAVAFCSELAKRTGRKATLPSEAEWEYAARAGTKTPFHFGTSLDGEMANCDGTNPYGAENKGPYLKQPREVGKYPANPWGLYDMHGNVWQWCQDYYGPYKDLSDIDPLRDKKYGSNSRVLRGGSWNNNGTYCRAFSRLRNDPGSRNNNVGFRPSFRLD
jgi:formylglycine-generating enzyme required for sulfatase activity